MRTATGCRTSRPTTGTWQPWWPTSCARGWCAIRAAGIADDRIVLDPGLGFAKKPDQNWQLLGRIGLVQELGFPLLVGASRKRFLGDLLADGGGVPRPVEERELAHAGILAVLVREGVWGVRVHDVRATCDVLAALDRIEKER